jgi:hypothetical protein
MEPFGLVGVDEMSLRSRRIGASVAGSAAPTSTAATVFGADAVAVCASVTRPM